MPPSTKKKALLVDDSKTVLEQLRGALEREFDCILAGNGAQALHIVTTQHVDVVISDLEMPIMDGVEMLRAMREHPAHKSTPAVMMTAAPAALSRVQPTWSVLLTKPFEIDSLMRALQS